MKAKLFQNKISVRPSQIHNYGVFADKNIKKGEMIEECYLVETEFTDKLNNYLFTIGNEKVCIALGYGMIYNHSPQSNAGFSLCEQGNVMAFVAKSFIRKGEEIFVNYGDNWFKDHGVTLKIPAVPFSIINNPVTISLTKMMIICGGLYGGFFLLLRFYQPWKELALTLGMMMLVK